MSDKKPDVICVSSGAIYAPDDVFAVNYDGAVLAKDAWECTSYTLTTLHAAQVAEVGRLRDVITRIKVISGQSMDYGSNDKAIQNIYNYSTEALKEKA